jgi:hypothetical protein
MQLGFSQVCLWKGGREERACSWVHATELLSSLWKEGKNKSMHLILGRGKGGKRMQLVLGRVGSHPFSLLVFIAPKVCGGVWDQGCPYPPFRLS